MTRRLPERAATAVTAVVGAVAVAVAVAVAALAVDVLMILAAAVPGRSIQSQAVWAVEQPAGAIRGNTA